MKNQEGTGGTTVAVVWKERFNVKTTTTTTTTTTLKVPLDKTGERIGYWVLSIQQNKNRKNIS